MNAADVAALRPLAQPAARPIHALRERMQRTGQWAPNQMAGRRWPVACVSLEITQRCNLDCTLCYLSDSSEAVRDFPLDELFRRIETIHAHYGPGTDVQVSGGEPTLRRRDELCAIVAKIAALGMRATLFTNGIKATRELLEALLRAGLSDVAFHVDTTQQRAGYTSETELNALREVYIERARGLPLGVFFNTTVHDSNFDDVPMLAAFFVAHADVVRFASFQLQAETGRGVLGARTESITNRTVAARLQQGAGTRLRFNALRTGHQECNQLAVLLVIGGRAFDAFEDEAFVARFMRETAQARIDRGTPWRSLRSLLAAGLRRPSLAWASLRWAARLAWKARRELVASRGRVHKVSLLTHNFMDACSLDRDRIDACVFMAITHEGPISMCAYNAQRDRWLLQPLATAGGLWQPLHPSSSAPAPRPGRMNGPVSVTIPLKLLKGRAREAALRSRAARDAKEAAA